MLPTFMHSRRTHNRPIEQTAKLVRLVECPREMIGLLGQIGIIEGTVGDEVLVRIGEIVVQVPPEYVEGAE